MEQNNSVKSLKDIPFETRTFVEKLRIKELGPDQPDISIIQQAKERGKEYTRTFSRNWFVKKRWLTACSEANALFCFPCLLFQTNGFDQAWTTTGVKDVKHMSERIKKHEQTRVHMESALKLAMFGKLNIAAQLNEGYKLGVRKHNEKVDKNRHILSKIIDCLKFCGVFELALCEHDESDGSENPGVFRGLVDFVGSLDLALHEHLQTATWFQQTSKTLQNDLLDCMSSVLRDYILDEVKGADFVSIQAGEMMDVSTQYQLVLVIRYIDKAHRVQERFLDCVPLQAATADSITSALLQRLSTILGHQKIKLIAQAYDGISVTRGAMGVVQKKVQDVYGNAHHVHCCCAHQLNVIVQQVTSHITGVSQFFSDLAGFSEFFSGSAKRTRVLDREVARRLNGAIIVRWNFDSRAVDIVFEHREDLLRCFTAIRDSGEFDPATVREAGGFVGLLADDRFLFFLGLFHRILPCVEILYSQQQERSNTVSVQRIMQQFTDSVEKIRESLSSYCEEYSESASPMRNKRQRTGPGDLHRIAKGVCNSILVHAKAQQPFTKQLTSATLLQGDKFSQHKSHFPDAALDTAWEAYPMLDCSKLKTELSIIYSNDEFNNCSSTVALYQLFMENNLQDTFSETVALLKILITTSMTTSETKRCFSTLKRIKTFLRNSKTQDGLNALAMISIEKKLVNDSPDFNNRVIEKFASLEERRATFMYK